MIELQPEQKPYFYVAAAMLSVEILYFLNLTNVPITGWAVYSAIVALSISLPMLVGACLGLMVGYMQPAKPLLLAGLLFGLLWFMLALAALSKLACVIAILVSLVSYKMLQYHHKDIKTAAAEAVGQQRGQADAPASGGPTA